MVGDNLYKAASRRGRGQCRQCILDRLREIKAGIPPSRPESKQNELARLYQLEEAVVALLGALDLDVSRPIVEIEALRALARVVVPPTDRRRRREMVSLVDVSATVLRLAGVGRAGLEGQSFLPLLRGDSSERWVGRLEIEGQ